MLVCPTLPHLIMVLLYMMTEWLDCRGARHSLAWEQQSAPVCLPARLDKPKPPPAVCQPWPTAQQHTVPVQTWASRPPAHLDEAHAAHVCRQVEHVLAALNHLCMGAGGMALVPSVLAAAPPMSSLISWQGLVCHAMPCKRCRGQWNPPLCPRTLRQLSNRRRSTRWNSSQNTSSGMCSFRFQSAAGRRQQAGAHLHGGPSSVLG